MQEDVEAKTYIKGPVSDWPDPISHAVVVGKVCFVSGQLLLMKLDNMLRAPLPQKLYEHLVMCLLHLRKPLLSKAIL